MIIQTGCTLARQKMTLSDTLFSVPFQLPAYMISLR